MKNKTTTLLATLVPAAALLFLIAITIYGSTPVFDFKKPNHQYLRIKKMATEYFQVYEERKDFDRFLSFYDDEIVLEDMINGDRILGKNNFANFFSWDNPNFKQSDSIPGRVIEHLAIDGNQIIAKGYSAPFKWYEKEFEAMQFTTWLFLNDKGKIIRHVDWINYPSDLVNYETRKNSNDWIKQEGIFQP